MSGISPGRGGSRARAFAALAAGLAVGLTGACGSSAASPPGSSANDPVRGTLTVFAAASLSESFTTLAKQFEQIHPNVNVKLSFGGSSALAQQIDAGAPADVFASAAQQNMEQVVNAGHAGAPVTFARNFMEIAVPPKNPAHVAGLSDLARAGLKVALCQPQVPCGAAAEEVFATAKLTVKPVTLEPDVKSTLAKVEAGEVDAAVVYVTDVRAAGSKVQGIVIPPGANASTTYPIAALRNAPNGVAANAFVAYLLTPAAQKVLAADGFKRP